MSATSRGRGAFAAVVLLVLIMDQLSKYWILDHFVLHESRPVIPGLFHLTLVMNTGAAFGILAGAPSLWRQVFFVVLTLVALIVLLLFHRRLASASLAASLGLAAIGGGALGNLVDRLRFGAVVDFLDVFWRQYHWPAFNLADSAISLGTGLVLWCTLWQERRAQR